MIFTREPSFLEQENYSAKMIVVEAKYSKAEACDYLQYVSARLFWLLLNDMYCTALLMIP